MGNQGMTMLTTTYPRIISLSTRTAARISPIGNIHRNAFSSTTTKSSSETLKKTPIYPLHVHPSNGAKMVPFAGFDMPLSYSKSGGQIAEHAAVRKECGLFDVSHMVQSRYRGKSAVEFLSKLLPSSLSSMKAYSSTLSVIMNEKGGILDDCLITRWGEQDWYLVTNAGRRDSDLAWIDKIRQEFPSDSLQMDILDGWGLLALQGPKASKILQPLLDDRSLSLDQSLFFGQSIHTKVAGTEVHIARSGYTGEDGFEISVPPTDALGFAELLAKQPGVTLTGLAARDSLRLEAGMCLYGADLDESVGVAEAGLGWVVGKERSGFFGEGRTRAEKGELIKRRRVGLTVEKGPPARSGALITDSNGQEVGVVTSGIPSPSLAGQNIAMAYVSSGLHKPGSKVNVLVRGKPRQAEVVKMPFVKSNYYRNSS
ncbi:Aminomethyltransferase, mitochondrial [Puccinia graminis f. sp. tritici]|uniref:Aminomethyltransferase n=1 Tax=Puccinia graminis f. sp. tritici TaxID=56615 RepID=A0A5B0RAP8_PUCGR|nr:Aminomethyltransferase, mitochondrial [Puccinia graminis f. sp. tritici]